MVTMFLQRMQNGDAGAADELLPLVYAELRAIAGRLLREGKPGHTLQPTALVHEAWLKLASAVAGGGGGFVGRVHFLAVAARAMRHVLIAHARERNAQKRGGGGAKVPLDHCLDRLEAETGDAVALDETLARLKLESERAAQVVEMRVFGGMTIEEAAEVLGVAATTVKADWRFARAWLQRELEDRA
ncbi:MAG: sigma-70 family RNA polymerase sigma factor [Planctomycetes bacterium]|nr:sigma-70 family RNA polymerase sigma factor [Planctomycetota bacterium]